MTDGWQPIETAPRDGTSVLLFTACHGITQAWFSAGEWEEHYEYGPQYNGPVWVCADDAFQIEVEEMGPDVDDMHHGTATHWQPLPPPPETP